MSKTAKTKLILGVVLLLLFIAFTVALKFIDVRQAGLPDAPMSERGVGLASFNESFLRRVGVNMPLYDLTEFWGYLALLIPFGFVILGIAQLIKRKSLKRVDGDIFVIAGLYASVVVLYVLFELIALNDRPILIDNEFEPSYPSSHTLLALTIIGSAILQFMHRIKNAPLKVTSIILLSILLVLIVLGRALSGVHWITDIIGSLLISGALLSFYAFAEELSIKKSKANIKNCQD